MILGVDARTRHDEDADRLAQHVREAVGRVLGPAAAAAAVLATHGLAGPPARTVVSCTVPGAAGPGDRLLGEVAGLLGPDGAVVLTGPGLPDGLQAGAEPTARGGAWAAVAAAASRTSGRLVLFPGHERLTGSLTVAEVLAVGGVDEVHVLGGGTLPGRTVVDTRGFVRPRLEGGRVRLLVQPAADGVMVPFERADPHRCCEDH